MPASNSKRIAKNTTLLYLRMLIVMFINIFSVRYVLKGLGVVDYGIFNVVAGVVTMFASLSSIVASATQRFYSYAIGEGKEEKVSDVFSASLNIYALLALAIFILGEIIGIWFINYQADISSDRITAANWVFQFTMVTFVISMITSPFSSLIFAYERMNVFSIISVSDCVLKFLLAYALVGILGDHLIIYGLGLLVIQASVFLAYLTTSRTGGGKYQYKRKVENGLYKRLLSFSGWTLFTSAAGIGISQLVTMITNVFFGPVVNAARAIAFQVNTAMNSFTGNIIVAIRPPMIKQYAEGDYSRVNSFFELSNKAIYYSLLLVLLPIFFEMETVLKLWLNVEDAQTILFCRLILIYALVLSLNNPISIIVQASGHIREYSTYVEIPTLLCFPLTWLLYYCGFPAESAFYVMIVAIIISHIIRMICLKRIFPVFSYRNYMLRFAIPAIIITILVSFVLFSVTSFLVMCLTRLFVSIIVCAFLVFTFGYFFGLNRKERALVNNVVLNFLKKNRQ